MTSEVRGGTDTGAPGPLAGLRVLEVADEKGQYCGKLMADLGADVIKIEPLGGENTRSIGPFLNDVPHRERSISFWHYNTSKRGITLNLDNADGQRLFRRLAATTDVLLESYPPGYMEARGLGVPALRAAEPSPHHVLADSIRTDRAMARLPNVGPASSGRGWSNGILRVRSRGRA